MAEDFGYSIYGANVGVSNKLNKGAVISRKGYVSGAKGFEFKLNDPNTVVTYDDFLGDVVADQWAFAEGTDSGTSDGAIVAAVNGTFVLTPGDSAGTTAADAAQLTSGTLQWKANQGGLVMQVRAKLAEITSVCTFIGLTDTASLEVPIESAASVDTITTTATDAVGFFFDTDMSTDNWWFAGVANNVDATHQNVGSAPVADTYATFRIEVDSSGAALGFYNGVPVGIRMSGAVTPTVALTPICVVRPNSAAAGKLLTVDYIYVAADRV